jgi:uncharacterized membrane protein required for colicin V production
LIIDAVLIFILALCIYRGWRNGLIRGVCGLLALLLSIVIANTAASAYSHTFDDMLKPFVGGIVESTMQNVLHPSGSDDSGTDPSASGDEIPPSGTYAVTAGVLGKLGIVTSAAERLAGEISDETDSVGYVLSAVITDKLCGIIAYILVFAVAFILCAIVFAVLGNLINLVFAIPGLKLADSVAGCVFGLGRGLIVIFFIALLLRYLGFLTAGTVEKTRLLEYIIQNNPIANALGI